MSRFFIVYFPECAIVNIGITRTPVQYFVLHVAQRHSGSDSVAILISKFVPRIIHQTVAMKIIYLTARRIM